MEDTPKTELPKEELKNWYFTFGSNHEYPNCYTVLHGTFSSARKEMVKKYGSRWAFQYDSPEKAGIKEFNLNRIW